MRVYLAGGKSEEWRRLVRRKWGRGVETFDPMADSRQGYIHQFTDDDVDALRSSDLLFAVVDYPRYTGLAAEIGYANALGIPVVLVWTIGGRLDGFLAALSSAVFIDVAEAAAFTQERYL